MLIVDPGGDPTVEEVLGRPWELPPEGFVFAGTSAFDRWAVAEDRLSAAFVGCQVAVERSAPIVFLVRSEDLQGRREALSAAVAVALVSCARALVMEGAKRDQSANVVAFDDATSQDRLRGTVRWLLASGTPRGEILDLGRGHFGRVHP
jgi:hypothetical protein